ncbi:MAG TPA: hypothetical protein VKY27_00515 [Bacteriovoracaceae bacterium]|nr:hypothetical protein [Bacteriovoracaceae bacterium]
MKSNLEEVVMKALCLLLVFVSFSSFAQVRENIKVKHQSQTRGKYIPETFKVEEPSISVVSQKQDPKSNKGNDKGKGKKK